MSVSRKSWAALTSLAQQWTLEDEEEQEREGQRRHRNLSFVVDYEEAPPSLDRDPPAPERLPSVEEAEGLRPLASDSRDEEAVQAVLRTQQEWRQRQWEAPIQEPPGVEEEARQPPLLPKGQMQLPPGWRLSPKCGKRGSEKPSAAGKTLEPAVSVDPEIASPSKWSVSQKISVLEESAGSGKRAVPEKTSVSEKRLVSEKAAVFEKTPTPDMQPAPSRAMAPVWPQALEQPASAECLSSPVGQRRAGPEKLESMAGPLPRAGGLPPITLQVRTRSTETEDEAPSPTRASPTFSSALQRSNPRTISFPMNPWRDSSEVALTSSTSVRLPASSLKLGRKLEQYLSAIQRSESVKCASLSSTEFLVAPVDVTSKRHLFEKELVGQSQEGPVSSRKENLQLSGVVTSRLNFWISRTQESVQQGPQEMQRESAASRRPQRKKPPEPPLGAEV